MLDKRLRLLWVLQDRIRELRHILQDVNDSVGVRNVLDSIHPDWIGEFYHQLIGKEETVNVAVAKVERGQP